MRPQPLCAEGTGGNYGKPNATLVVPKRTSVAENEFTLRVLSPSVMRPNQQASSPVGLGVHE